MLNGLNDVLEEEEDNEGIEDEEDSEGIEVTGVPSSTAIDVSTPSTLKNLGIFTFSF